MSQFNPKEVEEKWIHTVDKEGRSKYIHPDIVRSGGRRLAVFASDLRADSGELILAGKYLIPLPDIEVKDGQLLKVTRVWVTKPQAQKLLKLVGTDYKQIFRSNIAGFLVGVAAKAAEALFKASNVALDPVRKLVVDNLFQVLSDKAYREIKNSTNVGIELVELKLREIVSGLADSVNPIVREVAGDSFDLTSFVEAAVKPSLDELKTLF